MDYVVVVVSFLNWNFFFLLRLELGFSRVEEGGDCELVFDFVDFCRG